MPVSAVGKVVECRYQPSRSSAPFHHPCPLILQFGPITSRYPVGKGRHSVLKATFGASRRRCEPGHIPACTARGTAPASNHISRDEGRDYTVYACQDPSVARLRAATYTG